MNDTVLDKEIWMEIPITNGAYSVSNLGNIRSNDRIASDGRRLKGKLMKTYKIKPRGYHTVVFWLNGKKVHFLVHRLVYCTFNNIDIYIDLDVDHLDNDPDNNRLDNLELVTRSENINKGIYLKNILGDNYIIPSYKGSTSGKQGNEKAILMFNKDGSFVREFNSLVEAEKITGIKRNNISRALRGIFEHSGGYLWRYKDVD